MAINYDPIRSNKQAVLVDMSGDFTKLRFSFSLKFGSLNLPDSSSTVSSCSLVFKGEMYMFIFGPDTNHVFRVTGCSLDPIGILDFDFESGACTVSKRKIVLCFSLEEGKVCRVASSPTGSFSKNEIIASNVYHYYISIASNQRELRFFLLKQIKKN